MFNLSNVFILFYLKCTVDVFGVGPLGQMYHKHWKFFTELQYWNHIHQTCIISKAQAIKKKIKQNQKLWTCSRM